MSASTNWSRERSNAWVEHDPISGREVMIRHPAHPYSKPINARDKGAFENALHGMAGDYLALLGLLNNPHADRHVEWLPINPSDHFDDVWDPRNSFWVERYADPLQSPPQHPFDRTAVLLGRVPSMNGLRVRIVAHVHQDRGAEAAQIRITGLSVASPSDPDDWYEPCPTSKSELAHDRKRRAAAESTRATVKFFPADPLSDQGFERYAAVRPNRASFAPDPRSQRGIASIGTIGDLLRADGAKPPEARELDSRSVLEAPPVALAADPHFRVVGSPFVKGDVPPHETKTVPAKTPLAIQRGNDSAAVNAFLNARELFRRLTSYGFAPTQYFRFATLPLTIRYRSGLAPGPGKDGKIIDARADWKQGQEPRLDHNQLRPGDIEIKFALGDLDLSPELSPLGIACDPRVNWHEFSHALLMGAIGERELRFAHSGGDALAAILCDPRSRLASAPGWRGVTFPWVQIHGRRHDREVSRGWSWSGSMSQREHFYVGAEGNEKNTYWAEQILSTTLFRLYQAIGGNATKPGQQKEPDEAAREAAADHAVYLIMRAYALLGPAKFVPAKTPDQFVSALIDADIGTRVFGNDKRAGGTVHKVIRWAFQQQGLYAEGNASVAGNGPGEPEEVDVFIDQRPAADSNCGGYEPPNPLDKGRADRDEWVYRKDTAVRYDDQEQKYPVSVTVGNSGSRAATGVRVRVWFKELTEEERDDPCRIGWNRNSSEWKKMTLEHDPIEGESVASGASKCLRFQWPDKRPASPFVLLAEASAEADRSNIDEQTQLPCAVQSESVMHLVACDNNLGLRVVKP